MVFDHIPKTAVLFNPSAGKGRSAKRKSRIEDRLKALSIPYELFITESEDHLRKLTREKSVAYTSLVGCGGDSTVSIMVDEMMKRNIKIPLGMISTGSSNDIAREFGVDTLDKACRALKKGEKKAVDLGAVSYRENILRYYIGQANIGLGSFVAGYVELLSWKRPMIGRRQILAGFMGIRKAFKKGRHILPLTIRSGQKEINGPIMIAIFNNIKFWATGKILDPTSSTDDGRLDCCLLKPCSLFQLIRLSRLSQKQRLAESPEIAFLRSKAFDVSSEIPFTIQVDGELIGGFKIPRMFREVSFRTLPGSCTIIC